VVAVVPIAFCAPAVLVFIPPSLTLAPATLACFVQFPAFVIRLPTPTSVFLHCFVEFVLRMLNSSLASVRIFCLKARQANAKQDPCEND
jgi:hypothetical protein